MKKEVILLFMINMFSAMGYSIVAPLFPILGKEDSISEELLGWIISTYALADFFSTPFVPWYLRKFGRLRMLLFATFSEATCTLLYGFLEKFHSFYELIIIIFILRGLHGIASGIIGTLVYSLTCSLSDPEETQANLGYIEIAWSLGIAIGPLIASFFYHFGGYSLPFIMLGILLYISVYLAKSLNFPSLMTSSNDDNEEEPSFVGLLLNIKIIIILLSTVASLMSNTFYFPCLMNHLMDNYGLSVSIASIFFIIGIISYFTSLQYIDAISNKIGLYFSVYLGTLCACIGAYLVFPMDPFPLNIFFTIIGLLTIGISCAPNNVVTLVLVSNTIRKYNSNIDEYSANDIASAMYNLFVNVGDFSGPVLGGAFSSRFGFKHSCFFISLIIFIYSFLFLFFNYKEIINDVKMIKEKKEEINEVNIEKIKEKFHQQTKEVQESKFQLTKSISTSSLLQYQRKGGSFRYEGLGRKRHLSNLAMYNKASRSASKGSLLSDALSAN